MESSSSLPDYASHFVLSRSASPTLENGEIVALELDTPDAIHHTGDFTTGTLRLIQGTSNKIHRIEIVLLLTDTFSVATHTSTRRTAKSVKLNSVEIPLDSIPDSIERYTEWTYKFSLAIDANENVSKFHNPNALPPSFGDPMVDRPDSSFSASVSYSFVALAYTSSGICESRRQLITVLPKHDLSPLYDSRVATEPQVVKVGHLRKRTIGNLSLAVEHIPLLYIKPQKPNILDFVVYASGIADDLPPQISGIKYALVATTRSLQEYDINKVEQNTSHAMQETVTSATLALAKSAATWSKDDISSFLMHLRIPVLLEDSVPTFVSTLVRRDYSLTITLKISQGLNIDFHIPVTVVYC